nr:hypothetical protein [Tanacetum cinerariifolium]
IRSTLLIHGKDQEVPTAISGPSFDAEQLEKETVDSNLTLDPSDMFHNEGEANQYAEELEDERVLLASLIASLKLDLDENKKSQKQLRKANTLITQELNKSK